MNAPDVRKLENVSARTALEEVSAMLDSFGTRLPVSTLNWKGYDYKPEVSVAIAYGDEEIYLKYYVKEDYFKAEMTETNQMVCEDSCVEFFVSPADDGIYYNLEFNGIGTCLAGSGTGRADSTRINPELVSKIRGLSSAGSTPVPERRGEFSWTLTAAIPAELFFRHKIGDLKGKTFRANFYKCGDKLSVPHYVTWNPVGTPEPDYHRPEYFGMLRFV
jgi:hypothetical protein